MSATANHPDLLPSRHRIVRKSVAHFLQRNTLLQRVTGRVPWPYSDYLLLKQPPIIYCPVPKVASSNIKRWLLTKARLAESQWERDPVHGIHPFASRALRLPSVKMCFQESFTVFTFVRNPYARLVSAFLDKFVSSFERCLLAPRDHPAVPVMQWIASARKYETLSSVTFEDFVSFLARMPDLALNEHWLPQHRFFGRARIDFIGKVERFDEDWNSFALRVGTDTAPPLMKPGQSYEQEMLPYAGCLPIRELVRMDRFPAPRCFFNEGSAASVTSRYRMDFDRLGYSTDLSALR